MKTPIRKKREGFFGKAALFIGDLFNKKKTNSEEKEVKRFQGATNMVHYAIGGCSNWNPQAIFIPRHGKLKGYQRAETSCGRHKK